MARFLIHWTESVDYCGYIEVDDCETEDQLHDKIHTDASFNWYPTSDTCFIETMNSEVTKIPWHIVRMED